MRSRYECKLLRKKKFHVYEKRKKTKQNSDKSTQGTDVWWILNMYSFFNLLHTYCTYISTNEWNCQLLIQIFVHIQLIIISI